MRMILLLLISFLSAITIASGLTIMLHPDGKIMELPLSLLEDTPFKDFFVPGLVLALVVGGVNLVATVRMIGRKPTFYNWAIAGGLLMCGWILVQVLLIQEFHWLQPVFFGWGLFIALLAYQLKGKWAV